MAAHPDQFWLSGRPLRQVASLGQVSAGTFYVDDAHHRAYLGSNPARHQVRASTIGQALTVDAAGTVVRGIGIRRYAPSVPQLGAVTLQRPSITVDNVEISDMATTGVFVGSDNVTLRDVTVKRSGLLGIGANEAYEIRLIGVNSSGNNVEQFNTAPVSGGVKITRSRGILIQDSEFDRNTGPGIWLDESTYDSRIVGNRVSGNTGHGLSLEISAKSLVAGNLFLRNGGDGIKVNNTSGVQVWNNTLVGTGRSLDLVQDKRVPTSSYARDSRRPFPDPTMTWRLGPVTASNNVLQNTSADCLLCTEDYTHKPSARALGIHANGNIYNRPNVRPSWSVVWSRGSGDPSVYDTLSQFHAATGQEANGRLYDGLSVVNSNGVLAATVLARKASIARPLPSDVAAAVGQPSGSRQLGSWTN
jgi:parallel beta-helix repeat protein